jgi:hypothetical protein
MANRRSRYNEARLYMAGGSVGLLLIVWSVLAMKDRVPGTTADASTPQPTAAATSAPASSSSGTIKAPQATTKPRAIARPAPTARPQTRSSGS